METKETKYLHLKTNMEIPLALAIDETDNGIIVTVLDPTSDHPALQNGSYFALGNSNEMTFAFKKVPNPDHIDASIKQLQSINTETTNSISALTSLKERIMSEE